MDTNINLKEYLDILKRRKLIVIIVMIISLGLGAYKTYLNYSSYIPTYRSTITVRINTAKGIAKQIEEANKKKKDGDEDDTNNQLNVNQYLNFNVGSNKDIASTYSSLASSEKVKEIIANKLKISSAEVGTIEAVVREKIGDFIDITVTSRNPDVAKKAAKKVPDAFNSELVRLIGIDCVQVVYKETNPILVGRPTYLTPVKFGGVGIVVSIFLMLLAECIDTKIVTPDDINKYWNYQLIGTIPLDKESSKGKLGLKK